ncbi:TRAP transporter small permease [Kiloniella majae]|uniref:TRAP transporter small permease n=1 Tax=Kiloniella majae TaxID=1938558 RepID=UPI000A279397|nr:TRAP transporter small permease [Kiloniella majae]
MKYLFEKINKLTETLEKLVVFSAILLMMINSTANAIGRYAFDKSLYFSEELNQFLIVTITFIGFAYAVRMGRNIRMTALYDTFGPVAKKVVSTLISLTTAMLMFYLAYKAVFYVVELHEINRLSPALQLPVYTVYAIIPLGLGVAGLQYLIAFLMNVTHKEIYLSYDVTDS